MGSRLKEDEKNERAIRSLLKQTPNRRCINCNSLGPQYVCLNFWTFVCTTCSGIHREFTHRVKSVSMSKFSSQEVSALQSGGNERAREIYFKDWDPQRQPLPDSSNVDKLREFIKSVYVDKRFSGERSLPRGKGADREEAYESKRPEPRSDYRADSRSPPYEDKYEDRRSGPRRSEVGIDDRRYEDRAGRYDERRSPGRFDYDRNRYDKTYNDTRRYEDRGRYDSRDRQYDDRYNEGLDRRFEERFTHERRWSENPRHQRDYSGGSPPPIRPVKEILGDDIPPLRVEDHINGSREGDSLQRSQKDARGQRFGSSSSFGSVDGNAPVSKTGISESLIDFSAEPEAPAVGVQSEPFGFSVAQPTASTSNSTGWATFDMFSTATTAAPGSGVAEGFNNQSVQMNGAGQWPNQWASMQAGPALAAPAAATTLSHVSSPDAWSSLAGPDYQPSNSVTNSQVWSPFAASTMPTGPKPSTSDQLQAGNSQELQNASTSSTGMQIGSNANKQRQAIPEDFFTSLYPERNSSNMGFQMGLQVARAPPFGPQFSAFGGVGLAGQMLSYGQTAKSRNPFDFPGETPSTSTASEFPSMSPLQAALPNLNVGMMPLPGPGARAVGSQWPQSSLVASQPASYPSAVPTGAGFFIGQQMPSAHPLTMQVGSMGFTSGMGMPGGYMHAPPPSASDSLFPGQRAPLAQNLLNVVPTDSSFLGQGATELTPQSLLGQVGGNTVVLDSLHPPQRALQYLPQNSLVPPGSNTTGPDSLFLQKTPQFPSQSSLGPLGGNPFG